MISEGTIAMRAIDIQHMNGENEEFSYANNSFLQETAIRKLHLIIKKVIMSIANVDGYPQCFNIADLGCSSRPNTLLAVSNIINEVRESITRRRERIMAIVLFPPRLALFMGVSFRTKACTFFIQLAALAGFLRYHGLESNGLNVYMAKTTPPNVFEMYRMQFQMDLTAFLESRLKEIIQGGRMVLSFSGRSDVDPSCNDSTCLGELFAKSLADMAKEVHGSFKYFENLQVSDFVNGISYIGTYET